MFYCDENRPKLINKFKSKGEKVNISLISKEMGSGWKNLKDASKKKYNTLAEKDKERYQQEMNEYLENNDI